MDQPSPVCEELCHAVLRINKVCQGRLFITKRRQQSRPKACVMKQLTHCFTYTIVSDPLHMKRAMHLAAQQSTVAYRSPNLPQKAYKITFLLQETALSLFPSPLRIN